MKNKKTYAKLTSIFLSILMTISILYPGLVSRAYALETTKTFDIIEITDFHGALQDSSNNKVAAVLADRIKKG